MRISAIVIIFNVWILILTGCITPPPHIDPQVLSQDEVRLVSQVKRGKDYALSGRLDLAEGEFRRAMFREHATDLLYNDLGFSLEGQGRFEEAIANYSEAIRLNPKNVSAHQNLARALYKNEQFEKAAGEYQELVHLHLESLGSDPTNPGPGILTQSEIGGVYRNLSIIYYVLGVVDEALCFSRLALDHNPNVYETGQHARMLMSVNRIAQALQTLRHAVTINGAGISPKLLLDYGIALYASGEKKLAVEALNRVKSSDRADYGDQKSAALIELLGEAAGEPEEKLKQGFETLLKEQPALCQRTYPVGDDPQVDAYWPQNLLEDVKGLFEKYC